MVGTALGMMAMPQAVQLLLEEYNFRGSVLILGGVALHALVGSMLLQPIKWHLRPEEPKEEENQQLENKELEYEAQSPLLDKSKIVVTVIPASGDIDKQEPISRKRSQQLLRIVSTGSMSARKRKESVISNISSMDFTGSTCQIHTHMGSDEEDGQPGGLVMKNLGRKSRSPVNNDINKNLPTSEKGDDKIESEMSTSPRHISYWKRVVHFMDLD
ncbi:hypothetical protein B7P43_G03459, partial [Cryptotermes secundus]